MKKLKVLLLILFCSLSITGCFPNGENKSQSSMGSSIGLKLEEVPKTINKSLEKNLIVNGNINIPQDKNWKDKEVKLRKWDRSEIEREFLLGKKIVERKEKDNIKVKELKSISYFTDDESMLVLGAGNINFYEKKALDIPYDLLIRGSHPFLREDIGDIFKKDTLSNVNKDEAIKLVKNKLNKLGVNTLGDPKVYAMDLETMNSNEEFSKITVKDDVYKWQKSDEAYVISFKIQESGFPISQIGYITPSSLAAGTRLVSIVGADGLMKFELENVYEVQKDIEIDKQLIPFDSVLEAIAKKYKNVLLTDPVTIYNMELEYLPIALDAKKQLYKLSPMWICKAKQKTTYKDEKGEKEIYANFYIIIDAITGREFAIGGIS